MDPANHYENWNVNLADLTDGTGSACQNPSGWDTEGFFCVSRPQMSITSKFKEGNRNDPSGQYSSYDRTQQIRFGMIDIFPEAEQALMAGISTDPGEALDPPLDPPGPCFSEGAGDGPVLNSDPRCGEWMAGLLTGQKRNFSGLIGLYMFLKDPESYGVSGSGLLSLEQIHKIFSDQNFMNSRLSGWAPGYTPRNASNRWMSPVLAFSNGLFTLQEIFKWDSTAWTGNDANKVALLQAAYDASAMPYAQDFRMFEQIPSQQEIRDYIFGAAHHEGWNPTGGKFFYAAGKDTADYVTTPSATPELHPIFCKMTNKLTGAAMEVELSSNSMIECSSSVTGAVNDNGVVASVPTGFAYPYVLQERGWQGDDKGRIYALADRKTGMTVRPGDKEVLILQYKAEGSGTNTECKSNGEKNTVVTTKVRYGWGDQVKEEAVSAFCMDMADITTSGQIQFYYGGSVEVSQSDGNGNTWKWNVPQVGRFISGSGDFTTLPVCYFAPSGHFTTSPSTGLVTSTGPGAATISNGVITNVGNAIVDLCSVSHSGDKYYVIMMGMSKTDHSDLRAFLMGSGGSVGTNILQYYGWDSGKPWDQMNLAVSADALEAALVLAGQDNAKVAPTAAPEFTIGVKLANQKYDAKFDPFCDDRDNSGSCDCKAVGSDTQKPDAQSCTLEDVAAEPTLSQPPYWPESPNADQLKAFFAACGGKSGSQLQTCVDGGLDGLYIQTNSLWMDMNETFYCAYLVDGDTSYRKPKFLRWEGFYKNHDGCPNAQGELVALDWGNEANTGGPVRMINPKPMKNAYNIERPNTLVKLINYATKSTGQGISLAATDEVFSFDEAIALIVLRMRLPAEIAVWEPGTTSTSDPTKLRQDAFVYYEQVRLPGAGQGDKGKGSLGPADGVLRALTRPNEMPE